MKNILIVLIVSALNMAYSQPVQQWATHWTSFTGISDLDLAQSMAIDDAGNTYIVGHCRPVDNLDWVVLKVNSFGSVVWQRFYNHIGSGTDDALSVAADSWGNVYVTGYVPGGNLIIKYDASGNMLWKDSVRNSSFQSTSNATVKILCDGPGNVYVCGQFLDTAGGQQNMDAFVRKYNTFGNVVFTSQIEQPNFPAISHENSIDLFVDNSGNIYHAGYTNAFFRGEDWLITKISPTGAIMWMRAVSSQGVRNDRPWSIAVDNANGNVYIGGYELGVSDNFNDFVTAGFNSSGDTLWKRTEGAGDFLHGFAKHIGVDNSGNVYSNGVKFGFYTAKYSPTGTRLWEKTSFQNCLSLNNYINFQLMPNGDCYLTCQINEVCLSGGTGIAKINSSGVSQWEINYKRGSAAEFPRGIAINSFGNIFLAVYTFATSSDDITILKYSQNSSSAFQYNRNNLNKPIGDIQNTLDTINVNIPGDLLTQNISDVTIRIDTTLPTNDSDLDFYLIHNGITDTLIYQAGGSGDNFTGTILDDQGLALIANGSAPFTGLFKPSKPLSVFNGGNVNGSWILKVFDRAAGNTGTLKAWTLTVTTQQTNGIHQIGMGIPSEFKLSQNYPNPFNPVTNVKFQVPNRGFVKLIVFDITGREVETLVNRQLSPGIYEADWNASKYSSGVYFYKLVTESFTETKKMILVK